MKTTSRFAIAAAAGVLLGGIALSPASAADLGGDCCADLEERVAELEATTARKGNRVVSLTISGQVNKAVLFWDDGHDSDAYVVDNTWSSTRFRFSGSAKIDPDVSAGYVLEWEQKIGDPSAVDKDNEDAGQSSITARHAYWWIKSARLGQISVGQQSAATDGIYGIHLGSTGGADQTNLGDFTQGFGIRTSGGEVGLDWGVYYATKDGPRAKLVRYDSPTLHGFVLSAAWGEDDYYDVALRYAKEWNSIRFAAGIGWAHDSDDDTGSPGFSDNLGCVAGAETTSGSLSAFDAENIHVGPDTDCDLISGSASILHVPSGIFISVGASDLDDDNGPSEKWIGTIFGIQGRWTSFGTSTIYGAYAEEEGGDNVDFGEVTHWGFGFNQTIDSAAMDIYVGYRHHEIDITQGGGADESLEDHQEAFVGARIKF
jgi:hypothetical protein